jgi:hypothetical protein
VRLGKGLLSQGMLQKEMQQARQNSCEGDSANIKKKKKKAVFS